jgi:hypothetical protein
MFQEVIFKYLEWFYILNWMIRIDYGYYFQRVLKSERRYGYLSFIKQKNNLIKINLIIFIFILFIFCIFFLS